MSTENGIPVEDDEDLPSEEEAVAELEKQGFTNGQKGVDEEDEGEEEDDVRPAYMREEEPTGTVDRIKWLLLRGTPDEDIVASGENEGTVRIARNHLVHEGLLGKKPKKQKPPSTKLSAAKEAQPMQVFAKGSPPEAIINSISLPDAINGQAVVFEQGLKFGMSVLVLATRIMQELSAVGLQQSKPLIDIAKEMRAGETAAYKEGATEAAMKAASAMASTVLPAVASIEGAVERLEKSTKEGPDPMKAMIVRTMEPLINGMMKQLMPGMVSTDQAPQGWTKKKAEED